MYQKQGFHIVDVSPWPILVSTGAGMFISGIARGLHGYEGKYLFWFGLGRLLVSTLVWSRDVIREGVFEGQHTSRVQIGLRYGMLRFIFTEVIVFFSVFWAYRWAALSPGVDRGCVWPPKGIHALSPWEVPRRNTGLLLRSGVSVTWAHHSILSGDRESSLKGMLMTISLGLIFTMVQRFEYFDAKFSISDSVYGSAFYASTGFHGMHVIVGTFRLSFMTYRLWKHEFTKEHHRGIEVSIWYWHFVDVVWLVLYLVVYVWGS